MNKELTCFLSCAREDIDSARNLHRDLRASGVIIWFDESSLRHGKKWESAIRSGVRQSRYFIALLSSSSVSKKGFVQREIRAALDILDENPDDDIYLIPVRLDDCQPDHDRLQELNWVDLFPFPSQGTERLVRYFGLSQPESSQDVKESISADDDISTFSIIRFNGLYQLENDGIYEYLRFYDDGTVLSIASTGQPETVIFWLNLEQEADHGKGAYTIRGKKIEFTSRSKDGGAVDYVGSIEGNRIILRSHSHINDYRGVQEYAFRKQDKA